MKLFPWLLHSIWSSLATSCKELLVLWLCGVPLPCLFCFPHPASYRGSNVRHHDTMLPSILVCKQLTMTTPTRQVTTQPKFRGVLPSLKIIAQNTVIKMTSVHLLKCKKTESQNCSRYQNDISTPEMQENGITKLQSFLLVSNEKSVFFRTRKSDLKHAAIPAGMYVTPIPNKVFTDTAAKNRPFLDREILPKIQTVKPSFQEVLRAKNSFTELMKSASSLVSTTSVKHSMSWLGAFFFAQFRPCSQQELTTRTAAEQPDPFFSLYFWQFAIEQKIRCSYCRLKCRSHWHQLEISNSPVQ